MNEFEAYRPMMFSIAYRMLGSAMEADDIVQEAYLRYQAAEPERIQSPPAFLSTVVTRLCLDQLKSARAKRETYIGPWLPEPLPTGSFAASAAQSIDDESLSMAFMILLESLSPLERAVFLLREVFDYEYAEIAEIVGREEAACRQLFSRAKKHLAENRPRFRSSPQEHREILTRFLRAIQVGELEGLMSLLAEEVTSVSDGGGKAHAATRPLHGRERVARFFLGIRRFAPSEGVDVSIEEVNGEPAIILRRISGVPIAVLTVEIDDGVIRALRNILNPDKLLAFKR